MVEPGIQPVPVFSVGEAFLVLRPLQRADEARFARLPLDVMQNSCLAEDEEEPFVAVEGDSPEAVRLRELSFEKSTEGVLERLDFLASSRSAMLTPVRGAKSPDQLFDVSCDARS